MLVLSRKPGEAISVGLPTSVEGRRRMASLVRPGGTKPTGGTTPTGGTAGPAPCQAAPPPRRRLRGASPSRPGSWLGRAARRDA